MIGAGGHANVLAGLLKSQGIELHALVSRSEPSSESLLAELLWYRSDEDFISGNSPEDYSVINGVGAMPGSTASTSIFELYKKEKFDFLSIFADSAIVCPNVVFGEGVQLMQGVIIQSGVSIGDDSLINTGAIVDHDCKIGAHNHIASGACLSGGVVTANQVHVGTGANIIQEISIGESAVIGAGVSVVRDVRSGETIIPAAIRKIGAA